jgi:ribonuclease BN (tRNA processing enzyme)
MGDRMTTVAAGPVRPPSEATRRRVLGAGAALAAGAAWGQGWAADQPARPRSRLILLGTGGGPTPKPNRSAPAQVIVVNGSAYVIDCGNGVARQMVLAGVPLTSIRDVFITHHHSDHDADYGNLLLLAWESDLASRVDAYGPPPLAEMTRLFLAMNDYDIRTRIADEGRRPIKDLIAVHEISAEGPVMRDANVKVTAALVDHPPVKPAFAYRFDCPDRSIVISGDTRPSANLVRLAKGADVLVHEVMYLPALDQLIASEPNARTLRQHLLASHTTTEQVGRIATQAGVKTLVLSHFVPGGYPFIKDEVWYDAVRPYFSGKLIVGRDLMEI